MTGVQTCALPIWGVGGGSNFHQIDIQLTGHAQGFSQTDDAQGFIFRPADANLGGRDLTVQAMLAFLALATVAKFSSDGDYPCSKNFSVYGRCRPRAFV